MSDFAQEGGHWYRPDGTPAYTIVGKNGAERPVTLRDARKENLFPSVTGIIKNLALPALEKWKRNQLLLAALTLPKKAGESESAWLVRVERDWQEEGRAAAERGTAIHAAIEKHFRGEQPDEDLWPWVMAAKHAIEADCGEQRWAAERSFAHPIGYGGKIDLHSSGWVVDVKGKESLDLATLYDEHFMQLAAYRHGLFQHVWRPCDLVTDFPRCGILFVARTEPKALFIEAKESELVRGWKMFQALLTFWQAKTGHYPNNE